MSAKMSEDSAQKPPPPVGLAVLGQRLWNDLTTAWSLDADERILVGEAAAAVDELARMRIELARSELLVSGSQGQRVANPLIAEVRAHREGLRKLIGSIRAPSLDEQPTGSVISDAARAAAAARWRRRGGA